MTTNLTYTVERNHDGKPTLSRRATLRGREVPDEDLTCLLSALPDHYERHEALALLHAMTTDPHIAEDVINVLTRFLQDHYRALYERGLPEGWALWNPDESSDRLCVMAPGAVEPYATVPLSPVNKMREGLDRALRSIPKPPKPYPEDFDPACDLCQTDNHRCPGCGDAQGHSGESIHDGHAASECLDE